MNKFSESYEEQKALNKLIEIDRSFNILLGIVNELIPDNKKVVFYAKLREARDTALLAVL